MMRATCLTFLASVFVLAGPIQPAGAAILFHNGTFSSIPAGTNDVDVTILNNNFGISPDDFLEMDLLKEFGEIATHEAQVAFFQREIPAFETVINLSDAPWGEFRIDLESTSPIHFLGADLADASLIDPVGLLGPIEFTAIGGVTVLSSEIEQTSDTLASLVINFGDAVNPGEGFTLSFGIHHDFPTPTESEPIPPFLMRETPTPTLVPEPSSLTLLACGLIGLWGYTRRKHKQGLSATA